MIPKIEWFHWTGPEMSKLRRRGIASFKELNPDFTVRVVDTYPDVPRHLSYPQQADWTWWHYLNTLGGFLVATDIVFVRPIPDYWLGFDLVGSRNGGSGIFHNALVGCTPEHPYVKLLLEKCQAVLDIHGDKRPQDPQAFGPSLSQATPVEHPMLDLPIETVCPVRWNDTARLWFMDAVLVPHDCIGVHWYGGSKDCEEHTGKLAEIRLHG